jgi:predicted enzyme related to lactoylglutathione lyase
MIDSIVGITLWTNNLPEMFRFYSEILNFPIHSNHEGFIAFQLGDLRFNLGSHDQIYGLAKDPYRVMPNLNVDDIKSEYLRLLKAGVCFIRNPEMEEWGGWVATFKDPDCNILQLLQFPANK